MTTGISTADIPAASALDSVLGSKDIDGIRLTRQTSIPNLALQIVASSPFVSALPDFVYETKAALDADTTQPDNKLALIVEETANAGLYRWDDGGGAWIRVLPFVPGTQFVTGVDAGAGTPDAIQVNTTLPVTGGQLIATNIFEANTSADPTISFNGGAALPIFRQRGGTFLAGELPSFLLGTVTGGHFQSFFDVPNEATLAAITAIANTFGDLEALNATMIEASASATEAAAIVSALIGGAIYDTTAAGIAATVDGQFFIVKGDGAATYALMYKNVATVATLIASYPSKTALDAVVALLAVFSQPANATYDHILKDSTGRIAFAVRKDGEGVFSRLEVLNRFRTRELEARRMEFRRGGASVEAAFMEPRAGVAGFALGDMLGRQAMRMDAGGLTAPGLIREMEYHARGRSAGSATHIVRSRKRSVSSRNFDLYSINVSTGAEVMLTTDATDRWDFCDPAIFGSNCAYTRRAGGVQRLFVRPLDGSAPAKQAFPDKFLVTNGDSLVNNSYITKLAELTGLPLVDISFGGTSFADQVAFLAAKPELWRGILVMWEGGINPEGDIPNNVVAKIQAQVDMLTPFFKRWLILQPSPGILRLGDPGRQVGNPAHYDAQVAAIAAAFPINYVPVLATLQANNNGSAQDLADVAGDAVPSSLMSNPPADAIHLNPAGSEIGAGVAATEISNRGWN